MNSVALIGRITKDIEVRETANGKSMTRFTVAVPRINKDVDYISCVAWERTAELLKTFTHKGSLIGLTGRIQTGSYDDKDGKKVYTVDVIVESVNLTEGKGKQEEKQENFEELPF